MKTLTCTFLLLLTGIFQNLSAKCASSGLNFWPSSTAITANPVFMIEGYALSQDIIPELGKKHRVYLLAGAERIELLVIETHKGEFLLTQAILKPEKNLTPGSDYLLVMEGVDSNAVRRYNAASGEMEAIRWKVEGQEDHTAPQWVNTPFVAGSSSEMLGCGPMRFVNFGFSQKEYAQTLVKTTIKNLSSGKETTYYIPAGDEVIQVGHGMCSGAFYFGEKGLYQAEFILVDASGNYSSAAEVTSFNAPE